MCVCVCKKTHRGGGGAPPLWVGPRSQLKVSVSVVCINRYEFVGEKKGIIGHMYNNIYVCVIDSYTVVLPGLILRPSGVRV